MNTVGPEELQRQQMMALLNQQNQHVPEDPRPQPGTTPGYFPLDPSSAAKQIAALNATAQSRRASQAGGTSDTLFGPRQPVLDPAYVANRAVAFLSRMHAHDTSTSVQANRGPTVSAQALKSRRDEFLKFVAGVMNARHTPLPMSITGIPSAYDPATSRWKMIEPTAEPGGFRLAGKDVDLFKLWQVVLSMGGNAKLTRDSGWSAVLQHFGLPEEFPDAQGNGMISVPRLLATYYMALLAPFEEVYVRNMQQQQQKVIQARQQQLQQLGHSGPSVPDTSSAALSSHPVQTLPHGFPSSVPMATTHQQRNASEEHHSISPHSLDSAMAGQHQSPAAPISHASTPAPPGSDVLHSAVGNDAQDRSEAAGSPALAPSIVSDTDNEHRKRKLPEDDVGKRVRQKTDTPTAGQGTETTQELHRSAPKTQNIPQPQPTLQPQLQSPTRPPTSNASHLSRQNRIRRKIEYIPLARELGTYGGRDLDMVDAEFGKLATRRPQRSIDEWGTVDIDGLTMSLRSRLSTEISYALTVLSILSTMRGQTPDAGFNLHQCDDLLDELLDLLRQQAFGDQEDVPTDCETFWTHRELVTFVHEDGLHTFSDLPRTKCHFTTAGLRPSPSEIISIILNLFRNFSLIGENQRFIAQHQDALGLLLRVCALSAPIENGERRPPKPLSPTLTLSQVVRARRDVLAILTHLMPFTILTSYAPHIQTRLFELLASFLVEPFDLSSPTGIFIESGCNTATVRPPLVVDLALEAFSKLTQPDANRLAFSRGIKLSWLWTLFCSLVHRLPVGSEDFTITMRMQDVWLSYVEKVVLSIYSICFLASPELKAKIRSNRSLAFSKLILRMVKRFVSINHHEARQYFLVSSRRAVEALKLIDDGRDAFESPQATAPQLAFGMGFGETDAKQTETGTGLLAGFQEDVTWGIMSMSLVDDVMFAELDSLSRIAV